MTTPPTPTWQDWQDTKVKAEVLIYLQEAGWDIKKQTFYNACGDGKLRLNRSGVYSKRAVKKYAETYLVHLGLGTTVPEADEAKAERKLDLEIEGLATKNKREKLKHDKEAALLIERDLVELELASRAVVLDQGLDVFFRSTVTEMVAMVGGKADLAPSLLQFCLQKKNELMTNYASMEDFTVSLEPTEDLQ